MLSPGIRRRGCSIGVACLFALLALGAGAASQPPAPFKAPYLPVRDEEILQDVPSTADPAVLAMKTLRSALDTNPKDFAAAKNLAHAYVDYSRQVGDAHYAGYAEAVIASWMTLQAPPVAALVTQAMIVQYRHQFPEARALLQRALDIDRHNAQAWLLLATLDIVQGNYDAAVRDCAQVSKNAGSETGLGCFGSLRSYTGQARQSLMLLQQVEMSAAHASPGYRAWIQGLLAESSERLGEWSLAEGFYRSALRLQPEDNFLLVAYADFLLDRARPREVLPLLADHVQSDTAFLRLALAQAALHSTETPRYTWIMAARFEALRLRGSEYFGREESRFALQLQHDPQTALEMALRNWQVQRAPWDARVVLEAALAAGRPQAAVDTLYFIGETKLEDPIIEPMVRDLRAQLAAAGARR